MKLRGDWGGSNEKGLAAFLSSPYAGVRIVPFGSEYTPVNQIFDNLPWESSK